MKQLASRVLGVCLKQNRSKTEPRTRTRTRYLTHLGSSSSKTNLLTPVDAANWAWEC